MIIKRRERRELTEAEKKFLRGFAIISAVNISISFLIGRGIGLLIKTYFNL